MAVSWRAHDCFGSDIAGCACPVLDHEWLAELLRERLTQQAYEDVCAAASRIPNDHSNRPRWIGLRLRDPRQRRQRGSTRCQVQEFAAGKFHDSILCPGA